MTDTKIEDALKRFEDIFATAGVGREDPMGKTNYGKCFVCGRTGNRDSAGRCYNAKCKEARKPLTDPLEMQEAPELQIDHEMAGEPAEADGCRSVGVAQVEPLEKIEELSGEEPAQATTSAQDVTCYDAAAERAAQARAQTAGNNDVGQEEYPKKTEENGYQGSGPLRDHIAGSNKMVPDLPEDLDRPFVLAGIEFEPLPPAPDYAPALLTVRNKDLLAINKTAVIRFDIISYTHAKLIPGKDRNTVGVKFYRHHRPNSMRVQARKSADVVLSCREFIRSMTHLMHKKGVMEPTTWESFFVVRFGGETGEAA